MRKCTLPMLLLLVSVLAFLVYWPGLSGYFIFDDKLNIIDNPHLRIKEFGAASLINAAFSVGSGRAGR